MKVPTIDHETAYKVWTALMRDEEFSFSSINTVTVGSDDGVLSDLELQPLLIKVNAIRTHFEEKYPTKLPKARGGDVDAGIIEPIYHELVVCRLCSTDLLTNLGFWRWLSLVACNGKFASFIKWRFPDGNQVNWGITSEAQLIEVYLFRAYLRAHKMNESKSANPYEYAVKGTSDVWRSHILRQEFGQDKEFVKAFLDTIYDKNGKTVIGAKKLRTVLIPALRAWTSKASFAHLNYNECKQLIEQLLDEGI